MLLASSLRATLTMSISPYAASLKALTIAAAAPTAGRPLPRTSPMSSLTPNGVSTTS